KQRKHGASGVFGSYNAGSPFRNLPARARIPPRATNGSPSMNTCPSCSKPLQTNDLVCPHCGISLHPGTATAGPASGSAGGMSIVAIIAIVVVSIVLLLSCLGILGGAFWFFMAPRTALPTTPVSPPPPMVKKVPTVESMEALPVQEAPENRLPDDEAPPWQPNPEESTTPP